MTEAEQERERIVKWLQDVARKNESDGHGFSAREQFIVAEAIRRGFHLERKDSD